MPTKYRYEEHSRSYVRPESPSQTIYTEYHMPVSSQELVRQRRPEVAVGHNGRSQSSDPYYDRRLQDRRDYDRRDYDRRDYDRYDYDRRGYNDYYDNGDDGSRHRNRSRRRQHHHDDHRGRNLSTEQKALAALAGAALLAGGKELYDRHEAKEDGAEVRRNAVSSAALCAAGAIAAFQGAEAIQKRSRSQKRHHGAHDYHSDSDDGGRRHKSRRSSFVDKARALVGDKDHDDDYHRHESRGRELSRSRTPSPRGVSVRGAAMASMVAGGVEAFRIAGEPGPWKGEKLKRVITAAASAGGLGSLQNEEGHHKAETIASVMGGLATSRAIHGPKDAIVDDHHGRSRSRSRARSEGGGRGAAPALALAGAIAGKRLLDRSRSRSRSRGRGRRADSTDSYDSQTSKKSFRERSVSKARKMLSKVGLADAEESDHHEHAYSNDEYDDMHSRRSGYRGRDDRADRDYHAKSSSRRRSRRREDAKSDSSSDLGSLTDAEKRYKSMKGKSFLKTGLAAVAALNTANELHESLEKRQAREKALKAGELTECEASRMRRKAILMDVASVGIAVLGIKGAASSIKEAKEVSTEAYKFSKERHERRRKRREKRQRQPAIEGVSRDDNDDYGWEGDDDDYDYNYDYHRSRSSSRQQLPPAEITQHVHNPHLV